jgi:hypothetical protein
MTAAEFLAGKSDVWIKETHFIALVHVLVGPKFKAE